MAPSLSNCYNFRTLAAIGMFHFSYVGADRNDKFSYVGADRYLSIGDSARVFSFFIFSPPEMCRDMQMPSYRMPRYRGFTVLCTLSVQLSENRP